MLGAEEQTCSNSLSILKNFNCNGFRCLDFSSPSVMHTSCEGLWGNSWTNLHKFTLLGTILKYWSCRGKWVKSSRMFGIISVSYMNLIASYSCEGSRISWKLRGKIFEGKISLFLSLYAILLNSCIACEFCFPIAGSADFIIIPATKIQILSSEKPVSDRSILIDGIANSSCILGKISIFCF